MVRMVCIKVSGTIPTRSNSLKNVCFSILVGRVATTSQGISCEHQSIDTDIFNYYDTDILLILILKVLIMIYSICNHLRGISTEIF